MGKAQNLIPNGNFEEYWQCPQGNDLNDGQLERCKYWWKPTMGTSDYFNRCNTGVVSVPNNLWGYQEPYQGDGYVGLGAVSWNLATGDPNSYQFEYIQTKLIYPLVKCKSYRFTMYVSLANLSKYCFTKIGAVCTADAIFSINDSFLPSNGTMINSTSSICDTANWVEINGTFTASGSEQFLTIGYLFDSFENDTLLLQNTGFFPDEGYGYYYVDNVSMVEVEEDEFCEIILPNSFTPNNDQVNDVYSFAILSGLKNLKIKIINRWGNIVFENLQPSQFEWSGTLINNDECNEGVYFYSYEGETQTGILKTGTGFIQLIR